MIILKKILGELFPISRNDGSFGFFAGDDQKDKEEVSGLIHLDSPQLTGEHCETQQKLNISQFKGLQIGKIPYLIISLNVFLSKIHQ